MYRVSFTDSARIFFEDAQASLQRKLDRCFAQLATSPRDHPNIKPLKGVLAGAYRYRVGDYRVVYRIRDDTREVIVVIIAHRGSVYE